MKAVTDDLPTDLDQVSRLQEDVKRLTGALREAIELIDDLRGYTAHWDWKYGDGWDAEYKSIRSALSRDRC